MLSSSNGEEHRFVSNVGQLLESSGRREDSAMIETYEYSGAGPIVILDKVLTESTSFLRGGSVRIITTPAVSVCNPGSNR